MVDLCDDDDDSADSDDDEDDDGLWRPHHQRFSFGTDYFLDETL
jgi:hypothetical protein